VKLKRGEEIIGMTFSRLTVLERLYVTKHGHVVYLCQCSCSSAPVEVLRGHLLSGHTKSCSCWQRQVARHNINVGQHGRQR
jgi:hypothetical protein